MREGQLFACAYTLRSSYREMFYKKKFSENFRKICRKTGFRYQGCNSVKKVTPRQTFSCALFSEYLFYSTTLWDGFTRPKLIETIVEECKIFSTEHNNRFSSSLWYTNKLASKFSFWYECDTLLASVRMLELLEHRVRIKSSIFNQSHFFNLSSPNPRRREKIKLNFYFHTYLWCLKRFYEGR